MQRNIDAGRAVTQLAVDDQQLKSGLQNASQKLRDFGSQVAVVGKVVAAAGAAMLAPFVAAVQDFAKTGKALSKLSEQSGIGAAALGELKYAAEESDAKLDDLAGGLEHFSTLLEDARTHTGDARKELARLGLSFADLQAMDPEQRFEAVAAAIASIPDPARQMAAAVQLFGAQGSALLPMLKNLQKLRAEGKAGGLAMSAEAVEAAAAIAKAQRAVGDASKAMSGEIGAAFAKITIDSLQQVTGVIKAVTDWIKKNHDLVATFAQVGKVVAVAGAVLSGVGVALFGISSAAGIMAAGLGTVGAVLGALLSPFALVTAAVVGGVAWWAKYTESGQATAAALSETFGELSKIAVDTFGGIANALKAGDLELAGKIALVGLKLVFVTGMNAISQAIGGTWGKTIKLLGAQVAKGDWQAAWQTAVKAMSALWDNFCAGIWDALRDVMKKIVDYWQATVAAMTKFLLKTPIIKNVVLAGTGLDADQLSEKDRDLEQKRIEETKKRRAGAVAELQAEKDPDSENAKQLRAYIADIDETLAKAGEAQLFNIDANVDQQLKKAGDSIKQFIDDTAAYADAKAKDSDAALEDHADAHDGEADAEIKALRAQLAALNKQAEKQAKDAGADADEDNDKRQAAAQATPDAIQGTFSAAALQAMGGPDSVQEKQLTEMQEIKRAAIITANQIKDANRRLANLNKAK